MSMEWDTVKKEGPLDIKRQPTCPNGYKASLS